MSRLREEFIRLTKEYKKNLEQLLALYEKDVTRTQERLKQIKELYDQGLLAKRDLETSEQAVAAAQAKVDTTRQQIAKTDTQVAETLVEAEAEEQAAKAPAQKVPGTVGREHRIGGPCIRFRFAGSVSVLGERESLEPRLPAERNDQAALDATAAGIRRADRRDRDAPWSGPSTAPIAAAPPPHRAT